MKNYNLNNKFYLIPYMADGTEFDEFLYRIETFETTLLNGYEGGYGINNYINLTTVGNKYEGKILDIYHDGSYKSYIISLNILFIELFIIR